MNTADFAQAIRSKYPGAYDSKSDQELTQAWVTKYPVYQSQISDFGQPAQPTTKNSSLDIAKAFAEATPGPLGHLANTLLNIPGDLARNAEGALGAIPAAVYNAADPINFAKDVAEAGPGMIKDTANSVMEAVKNPAKTVEENPISTGLALSGLGDMYKATAPSLEGSLGSWFSALKKDSKLASFNQKVLGVSENATKMGGMGTSASSADVEAGVNNVIDTFKKVEDKYGSMLKAAKQELGLPATWEETKASIETFGNKYNLDLSKPLALPEEMLKQSPKMEEAIAGATTHDTPLKSAVPSTPPDGYKISPWKDKVGLSQEIDKFLENQKFISTQDKVKAASYFQDQINSAGVDFGKEQGVDEGILKGQYNKLKNVIDTNSENLQAAKTQWADYKKRFNIIAKNIDPAQPGKTQAYLKRLFTSKSAKAQDALLQLAELDKAAGTKSVETLFKLFAGQEFGQLVGPEGKYLLKRTVPLAVGSAYFGHPLVGLGALAGELAATSPALVGGLEAAGKASVPPLLKYGPAAAVAGPIGHALSNKVNTAGYSLADLLDEQSRRTAQSIKDKLRNAYNAK